MKFPKLLPSCIHSSARLRLRDADNFAVIAVVTLRDNTVTCPRKFLRQAQYGHSRNRGLGGLIHGVLNLNPGLVEKEGKQVEIQGWGRKRKRGEAPSFAGRRPTCKSFRMTQAEGDFDGGRIFGLSILMLLIKPQTAADVDANGKARVVKRRGE